MKLNNKSSVSIIRKIILMVVILVAVFTVGVIATNKNVNLIKIVFDDSEITVITSKTKVSEILDAQKIVLLEDEHVYPSLESDIDVTKTITISKQQKENIIISEETEAITTEEILGNYITITEKIIVEEEEIPFETITQDISNSDTDTSDRVVQEGQNGLKQVKYKAKFKDEIELIDERVLISEEIIKEPVDKIIQIYTKVTNRSAARSTEIAATSGAVSNSVEGKEPKVVTMNASAYTAATCGKAPGSPGYGRTASGATAKSYYTVAAGSAYPIGTVVYIPYFADSPNGGWFVVQDRGGAISNNRIDIYFDTVGECSSFGRKNLECYIYE